MRQSRKMWLAVLYAGNAVGAFLWLFAFGSRYSFHLAGLYVTPGILAIAVMLKSPNASNPNRPTPAV